MPRSREWSLRACPRRDIMWERRFEPVKELHVAQPAGAARAQIEGGRPDLVIVRVHLSTQSPRRLRPPRLVVGLRLARGRSGLPQDPWPAAAHTPHRAATQPADRSADEWRHKPQPHHVGPHELSLRASPQRSFATSQLSRSSLDAQLPLDPLGLSGATPPGCVVSGRLAPRKPCSGQGWTRPGDNTLDAGTIS